MFKAGQKEAACFGGPCFGGRDRFAGLSDRQLKFLGLFPLSPSAEVFSFAEGKYLANLVPTFKKMSFSTAEVVSRSFCTSLWRHINRPAPRPCSGVKSGTVGLPSARCELRLRIHVGLWSIWDEHREVLMFSGRTEGTLSGNQANNPNKCMTRPGSSVFW